MKEEVFQLSQARVTQLKQQYPNLEKNSHVGGYAVEVVKDYFTSKYSKVSFNRGSNGSDLEVVLPTSTECFEIKGTASHDISWSKLKVSSTASHKALTNGLILIRVTSIGSLSMKLYFMKFGEDFDLRAEPRWSVVKFKG